MDLRELRDALRALPQARDAETAAEDGVGDLLTAAGEISRALRRLGVQQMKDSREVLAACNSLKGQAGDVEPLRAAWQREQQRAADSERQQKELARVVIATLDVFDRMLSAFRSLEGMRDWAEQSELAIARCLRQADRAGLAALGTPGEPFDETIHDGGQHLDGGGGTLVVESVAIRGYALNGQLLRRARVNVTEGGL